MARREKREFDPAFHHPVVEFARHIASPLSAGLAIIALQKRWQFPLLKDVAYAYWHSARHPFWRSKKTNCADSAAAAAGAAKGWNASNQQGVRAYSTRAGICASKLSGNNAAVSRPFSRLPSDTRPISAVFSKMPFKPATAQVQSTADKQTAFLAAGGMFDTFFDMFKPQLSEGEMTKQLEHIYDSEVVPEVISHIVDFPTIHFVDNLLHLIHDTAGLPWWATIMVYTFGLRMTLVPMFVHVLRNSTRIKIAMGELVDFKKKVHAEDQIAAPKEEALMERSKALCGILSKHKCNPVKDLYAPFILPPVILSSYFAIHNILLYDPNVSIEGFLWMRDLAEVDSTFLLPVLCNASWLLLMELSAGVYYHFWAPVKNITRFVAVSTVPLACGMPIGVLLFWTTSNCIALGRVSLLQTDAVRDFFRIPRVSTVQSLPYLPKVEPPNRKVDQAFFAEWSKPAISKPTSF